MMTSWYHVACWPVPQKLTCLDEIENWDTLSDAHKNAIIARAPNRAPGGGGPSTKASPARAAAAAAASIPASPWAAAAAAAGSASSVAARPTPKDGPPTATLTDFVALCDDLESTSGSNDKISLITRHLSSATKCPTLIDKYLTARLLLPSKKDGDQRVYQLKDKSLITALALTLRCSEQAMSSHLEQVGDSSSTPSPSHHPPTSYLPSHTTHHYYSRVMSG